MPTLQLSRLEVELDISQPRNLEIDSNSLTSDLPPSPQMIEPQSQALSNFHDLLAAQVAAEISTGGNGPLILPSLTHTHPNIHSIQDYLHLLNLREVPLIHPNMGVDYATWPPVGIHHQRTHSWFYMALILQSANGGMPVLPIQIPEDLQPTWNRWVETIQQSVTHLPLGAFTVIFDGPFHLPPRTQNAIITNASVPLGQEIEHFLTFLLNQNPRSARNSTMRQRQPTNRQAPPAQTQSNSDPPSNIHSSTSSPHTSLDSGTQAPRSRGRPPNNTQPRALLQSTTTQNQQQALPQTIREGTQPQPLPATATSTIQQQSQSHGNTMSATARQSTIQQRQSSNKIELTVRTADVLLSTAHFFTIAI